MTIRRSSTRQADVRRDADLAAVRSTYSRYVASGHTLRWDASNPGEARNLRAARKAMVENMLAVLPASGGRVLDLGCGDGSLAVVARQAGINAEWWGVDIREDAILAARASHPWATFSVSSGDALEFDGEWFDVVVASVVFSSIPSSVMEHRIAAEIRRVLKPGGSLVWYDMRYPSPSNAAVHPIGLRRLRLLFPGWRRQFVSTTLIPPLARRLGRATPLVYPLMLRLPAMRSHLLGRLTKPAVPRGTPRILLVTGLWPTEDMPSAGAFVRDRVGNDPAIHVIAPRRYAGSVAVRYLRLAWKALTARGRFDGVEAHVLFPTGVIGLLAAKIRGIPLVVYVHGDEVRHAVYRNRLFTWLGRRVSMGATAIVVNSRDTATYAAKLGGPAPVINPPGVDLQRFRPSPRPAERRVLYVGGERSEKGVDIARQLADTIVGPYLEEVPPEEMPDLMARHDVLLMPSREEGFGVAAAEAIASGRWVVAGAVGGLRELITDGLNGTLVDDGDFRKALAEVPEFQPEAVAATAVRFDVAEHRRGMARLWRDALAR